jgi:LAO/AO transport system kinase
MEVGDSRQVSLEELFRGLRKGDKLSASRLMTLIENEGREGEEALKKIYSLNGRSLVIGITGWPGVGKSTLISRIAKAFLDEGKKVGIIAVDPTSPFSGGGLLGDRLRFRSIDGHDRLFIRSAASRGYQGGLSRAARAFVKVMEAMTMDVVLLETVGIGQEQVGVSLVADTTVVVLAPGLGDYLQAIKSGIIEIGDIFVVNKAERPDADKTVQDMTAAILMREEKGWRPPVVKTITADGTGTDNLMAELERHRAYCNTLADVPAAKARAASSEIEEAIKNRLLDDYLKEEGSRSKAIEAHAGAVCRRQSDPYLVVDMMLGEQNSNRPR